MRFSGGQWALTVTRNFLEMYFGNYTTLVYQAQTQDPLLEAKAQDCARRMRLAYEYRFTGYGDLAATLFAVADNR